MSGRGDYGAGDGPVIDRIRQQMMVGDPQTIVPRPCEGCGAPVLIVAKGGNWVIEWHQDPETHVECPQSYKIDKPIR